MEKWFALYTRPRHEKKSYDLLTEKGVTAYLPLVKSIKFYKNRKKESQVPLFTSYLFCKFDYKNRFQILETHGVIKVVSFKGLPAEVPEWQIEALKKIMENPESLRLENYFRPGDLVKVNNGPFKGLQGTVVNRKGETRLMITIEGIMQTLSVEIDSDYVEVVKEAV